MRVSLDGAKYLFSEGIGEVAGLLPHEGSAPGIGPQLAKFVAAGLDQLLVVLLLAVDILGGVVAHLVQLHHAAGQVAQALPGLALWIEERAVPFALVFVLLFVFAADFLVIALDGLEGAVGDAVRQQRGRSS